VTDYALSSPKITGVTFDWGTDILEGFESDNFPLTWAANGHQYTSWGDGWGFEGDPEVVGDKKSIGYSRIEGDWGSQTYRDTFGTPEAEALSNIDGKSYAIVSVNGGTLYSFISPGSTNTNLERAQLYKSTDNGQSWTAVSPTVQYTNASHGIGLPGFLQFGQDYAGARDEYLYTYWTKLQGSTWGIQSPGQYRLSRVPLASIETQANWQFVTGFTGVGKSRVPTWGTVANGISVFDDSAGVVIPSCAYNPWLKRYLLCSFNTAWDQGYLTISEAVEPWGPWRTLYAPGRWPPGSEVARTSFYANFSPKWWSNHGRDFVLCFSGIVTLDAFCAVKGSFTVSV
jgi:hypothetical protein